MYKRQTLTATGANAFDPIVVTVTQKAFEASIITVPTELSFSSDAGSETIAVTANVTWSAESNAAWLTLTSTADEITATATENIGTEARTATITITGDGVTETVAVTQAGAGGGGDLLFLGSDFNDWSVFTGALDGGVKFATESANGGRGGSGAMLISSTGTGKSNGYIFKAKVPTGFSAAGKTEITFWIKGTSTTSSLSMNVNTSSGEKFYNLGATTTDKTLMPTSQNAYGGDIDTGGEWIKVTLDISTLNINTTVGGSLFALKFGKNATYDLLVDDIMIE